MFRFINAESKTIVSAAAIVGVLSFASRVFGLIRDRVLAGEFGAGDVLDAYYAAFKLPDLTFSLIVVGALSASFIPLFTKYYYSHLNQKRAWEITNNVLHLIVISVTVIAVVLAIFAHPLAGLIAPGFTGAKRILVADFTRVMLLAQIILAVSVVYGSVLQGMKRFFLYSLAPIFYNIGIIIGGVWLVDWVGPIGLAWGVVLGALLHLVVQIFGVVQAGYRYRWTMHVADRDTQDIFRLMGPRMLSIGLGQINFLILTIIATTLAAGSVTVFQFAYNIQFFAVGIVGVSYAVAAFPSFAEHLGRGDTKKFISLFSSTIRQVLFLMVPLMILFLILRAQIVRVVVGAGAFDWTATILTANTLAFFTLSLIAQALIFIVVRAFFALHDTVSPLLAGVVASVLGLISALFFTQTFGVVGLGMAFSLSAIVNLALLWVPLRQRIGTLDEAHIVRSLLSISSAGLACAVVMQSLKGLVVGRFFTLDTFFGVLGQGLVAGGIGLIVYVGVAYVLKSEELLDILSGVRKRFFARYRPEEAIPAESTTAT